MTVESKPRQVTVTLSIKGDLAEALDRFEAKLGLTHAQAARLALREYLTLSGYLEPKRSSGRTY